MKKAKASEVPPMYRRNRWHEFLDFLLCAATMFAVVVIFMFIFVVFGR